MRYDNLIRRAMAGITLVSALLVLAVFGFMIFLGLPLIMEGRLLDLVTGPWNPSGGSYGIFPMLSGTLWISSIAIVAGFPLSMGVSAFIYLYRTHPLSTAVRRLVELMTGIPTVIYGFVGIFLLVPLVRELSEGRAGMCILSAGLLLSILVAPTMILFFIESFNQVPATYLQAACALGACRSQRFLRIVLPCAWRGIAGGVVLAMGRAMGDTLIALMVAGNAVAVPGSPLDSARPLTAHIALVIAADFDSLEFKTLYICGIVLYLFSSGMVIVIRKTLTLPEGKFHDQDS